MGNETEIKLGVTDAAKLRVSLASIRVRPAQPGRLRVHEMNAVFDTPDGALRRSGKLVRIRVETPVDSRGRKISKLRRVLLTFKGPVPPSGKKGAIRRPARHKVRQEIELEVAKAGPLAKIFEALGMTARIRYEKYRATYHFPASESWAKGLLVEVDETPIGTFVELEGGARAIDRAAKLLGYGHKDYILQNYLVLYREECRKRGQEMGDMVFSGRSPSRSAVHATVSSKKTIRKSR